MVIATVTPVSKIETPAMIPESPISGDEGTIVIVVETIMVMAMPGGISVVRFGRIDVLNGYGSRCISLVIT